MTRRGALTLALALGALVRAPFLLFALRTPVDADTAIIGLMARHPLRSTTMWGQPYGSPLEAWLAAPFVLAIEPGALALRLFYALLGLGLVAVAYLLAEAIDRRAALPAALLTACPPSYLLLLGVLPPPLYPSTLLLGGLALVGALRIGARLERGETPVGAAVLWGVASGLALWTHLSALGPVAAGGLYLLLKGRRRPLVPVTAGLAVALGSLPLWAVEARYGGLWRVVRVSGGHESFAAHFRMLAASLHTTLGGLFGAHTPLAADAHELVLTPSLVVVLLGVLYAASALLLVPRLVRENGPRLIVAAAVFAVVAFLVPLRSQPHTTRFLVGLYLPVTVGVAVAWSGRRLASAAIASLCLLNLIGGLALLRSWRGLDDVRSPFYAGPVGQVEAFLGARHVTRAFADYELAYRMTFASRERLVVSQPLNERFPGHPLPYLDEVRGAPDLAWILAPASRTRLPSAKAFERALDHAGGAWKVRRFGPLSVYFGFEPPYGPDVVTLAGVDVTAAGTVVPLAERAGLVAVELRAPSRPWPRDLTVEASEDGRTFAIVERLRHPEPFRLAWVNGHPEPVPAPDVLVVRLSGHPLAALRLSQEEPVPLHIGQLLLHPVR